MSRFLRARVARPRVVLCALAAVLVFAIPAAGAQAGPVQIQTQNLYLGSDLTPAIVASNPPAFFAAVNQIWANVKASDFPSRAQQIAKEVDQKKPDILALQEVSKWTATNLAPSSTEPSYDFLAILQAALSARKLDYTVASVSNNANIGPIPLPGPGAPLPSPTFLLTFQDRDVILVRNAKDVSYTNPQSGNFATQLVVPSPVGGQPLSFNRGWASIDAVVGKQAFHFVDSHLETEAAPPVQVAQGNELLAGPLAGPGPTIAAGDFNSAADGSTTATYANLTAVFADVWTTGNHPGGPKDPGFSCCQAPDLLNPKSLLSERIDLILTKIAGRQAKPNAELVGEKPGDRTKAGLWPSDHAGLFAQ